MTSQASPDTAAPALTLAMVASFHQDPATQALKDKLFLARAKALIVREDVDALLEPAFAQTDYRDEDTNERITCEADLYLVAENVDVSGWYATRDVVLLAAGYEVGERGVGLCPALSAESDVLAVENELLRHASAHFGMDFTRPIPGLRSRAVELFSADVAD